MTDREDFQLTATELQAKYGPEGTYDHNGDEGEHPELSAWDWRQKVAQRTTRLGYWDWVESMLERDSEAHD